MKHAILDHSNSSILAICEDGGMAHSMAEVISYKRNGNAIYGLFKLQTISLDDLLSNESGRKAWNEWHSQR